MSIANLVKMIIVAVTEADIQSLYNTTSINGMTRKSMIEFTPASILKYINTTPSKPARSPLRIDIYLVLYSSGPFLNNCL